VRLSGDNLLRTGLVPVGRSGMRSMNAKFLAFVCLSVFCEGLLANGFPQVWMDCDPIEPFKGKAQEMYLGNEFHCYRLEFKCDDELWGGFLMEVNTDDGGVGLFGGINSNDGFCVMNFGHLGNTQFTHACSFENGDAELEVKAADGEMCLGY
jgi:hypothetical protein